jgi:hypothetical protein
LGKRKRPTAFPPCRRQIIDPKIQQKKSRSEEERIIQGRSHEGLLENPEETTLRMVGCTWRLARMMKRVFYILGSCLQKLPDHLFSKAETMNPASNLLMKSPPRHH